MRGWSTKYTKILNLANEGLSAAEIAKRVGMKERGVFKVFAKDKFKERLKAVESHAMAKAKEILEARVIDAVNKIVQLARSGKPDQRIQLDAAKEILYMVGMKPIEVIETRKREYTPAELESALKITKEVETITARLSRGGSRFVLSKKTDDTPISTVEDVSASVPAEPAKTEEQTTGAE